ncbi:hypothetical protein AVEN_202078-1 [Araneus ventricosus]|uniref:Uncharacterized protein n=1 Tax=Araneus ventricosus TaxID=182803 RepID=A0A4Y2L102_ARAVE|nr:hypothetical protein AVEN_202078-1 [Araneus ventricosus]
MCTEETLCYEYNSLGTRGRPSREVGADVESATFHSTNPHCAKGCHLSRQPTKPSPSVPSCRNLPRCSHCDGAGTWKVPGRALSPRAPETRADADSVVSAEWKTSWRSSLEPFLPPPTCERMKIGRCRVEKVCRGDEITSTSVGRLPRSGLFLSLAVRVART